MPSLLRPKETRLFFPRILNLPMKDKSPSFKTTVWRPEYFVDCSRSFWLALFGQAFGKEFFVVGIEDVAEFSADT
ncbi:MAG: hypothetical protein VW701_04420 [Deltaproteobacteria bacterium]